jgi:transposase
MDQQADTSVVSHITELEASEKTSHERLKELQKEVREIYLQMDRQRVMKESLKAFQKAHPEPEAPPPPSQSIRKKYQPIPKETKALVAKKVLYEGSLGWDDARTTFDISRTSISRILRAEKHKIDGEPAPTPKKHGRKSPISAAVLVFILLELEKDSQLTLDQMVQKVETEFSIESSTSAIDRALSAMDISWKNTLPIPIDWNKEVVIQARMEFIAKLGPLFLRNIVYVDESGFNMHCKKSKGRAVKGEPARLTLVPKGKRLTIIAALVQSGFVHWRLVESLSDKKKGTNAEDFRNFLIDMFPKLPRDSVIILDNCKIHHSDNLDSTWWMAKTTYGIDKIFLPPYSPFLNPIEYAFNALKTAVAASYFENRGELRSRVQDNLQTSVTPEDAAGFYRRVGKYYKQCALGLPFRGKPLDPEIPSEETPQPNLLSLPSN